jgi:hypothetical protein
MDDSDSRFFRKIYIYLPNHTALYAKDSIINAYRSEKFNPQCHALIIQL